MDKTEVYICLQVSMLQTQGNEAHVDSTIAQQLEILGKLDQGHK